mmetsp:Transcript_5635/g.8575  ORF Transcript_5635/g.8575 Transcript_5635/m.8575 type:complete len:102 (+) Transcript_5635:54-359(+)
MNKKLFLLVLYTLTITTVSSGALRAHQYDNTPSDRNVIVTHWPELKGVHYEDARTAILSDRPELHVLVVPQDAMVTADYREDRVRLFVNDEGITVRTPHIG